ncbi:MAG: DNA polymerase III subunit chi [Pseudomonadota bacterium]
MTEIEFHFNVPGKLQYACRLLRKVHKSGARAIVTAEQNILQELDRVLWQVSPTSFLPHCMSGAPAQSLAASPIWLATDLQECPRDSVLINLGQGIPDGFDGFSRFLELVSEDPADRLAGRGRWKHYKDKGFELLRHDLAANREAA